MSEPPRPSSVLTREKALYTAARLSECRPEHLLGLLDLLRFGIASSGSVSGGCVGAAWLLNAARFQGLPMEQPYRRRDGSGFPHCDGDWLEARVQRSDSMAQQFHDALAAVKAPRRKTPWSLAALSQALAERRPCVRVSDSALHLVLALNPERNRVFCCEIEPTRARLRWIAPVDGELVSLTRERSDAEREACGLHAIDATSDEGGALLPRAEGLAVIAYAALHGHTQRDLSSCNVASLSSVRLKRGSRGRVIKRASDQIDTPAIEPQQTLRALAAQRLKADKGVDFEFRGLSLDELHQVATDVGLTARVYETVEANEATLNQMREHARSALGRIIVNFHRPALGQQGSGHHAVLVAYHPGKDVFLVDDPAGFKMPPYWVRAEALLGAMATLDITPGVQRHRGYVIIEGEGGAEAEDEFSGSVVFDSRG
jgi:hypothetical protein